MAHSFSPTSERTVLGTPASRRELIRLESRRILPVALALFGALLTMVGVLLIADADRKLTEQSPTVLALGAGLIIGLLVPLVVAMIATGVRRAERDRELITSTLSRDDLDKIAGEIRSATEAPPTPPARRAAR